MLSPCYNSRSSKKHGKFERVSAINYSFIIEKG